MNLLYVHLVAIVKLVLSTAMSSYVLSVHSAIPRVCTMHLVAHLVLLVSIVRHLVYLLQPETVRLVTFAEVVVPYQLLSRVDRACFDLAMWEIPPLIWLWPTTCVLAVTTVLLAPCTLLLVQPVQTLPREGWQMWLTVQLVLVDTTVLRTAPFTPVIYVQLDTTVHLVLHL